MTKNEAKASIEALATKEGRKIAISELPKNFVVEGQEVVCSNGRFRSDDRHFWPNGVKPAAEDKTTAGTTTKRTTAGTTTKRTTAGTTTKRKTNKVDNYVLCQKLKEIARTQNYVSQLTYDLLRIYSDELKQAYKTECSANQYNEQLKAKAAAKQAAAAKKQAAATVAKDDDLIIKVMSERAAAGDAAAAAYLESVGKLNEARKAESATAAETAEKVAKVATAKPTAKRAKKTA